MGSRPPHPGTGREEDIFHQVVRRLKRYVNRYGMPVGVLVAAILAGLLAYQNYRAKQRAKQASAWQEYGQLPQLQAQAWQSPEEETIEEAIAGARSILDTGAETHVAPWALLKLANAQRMGGRWEEALQTYRRLRRGHPQHYATRLGAPGLAATLEEVGEFDQAAKQYETIAQQQQGLGRFWLDAGRCWELAGNRGAALYAYQNFAESAEQQQDGDPVEIAADRTEALQAGAELLPAPPPLPAPQEREPQVEPAEGQPARPTEQESRGEPSSLLP